MARAKTFFPVFPKPDRAEIIQYCWKQAIRVIVKGFLSAANTHNIIRQSRADAISAELMLVLET
jgi:hypothetical protein